MSDWKPAHPVGFHLLNDERCGCTYRAAVSQRPPMEVKKILPEELPSDRASVVFEFEDMYKVSENQLFGRSNDTVLRLVLNARDARYLAYSLIKSLADGGDRIAEQLVEKASEIMDTMQDDSM